MRACFELVAAAIVVVPCVAAAPSCGERTVETPDGDADVDVAVDADEHVAPDATLAPVSCDLLEDEGCAEGETCATMVRSGVETMVGCVPRRPADQTAATGMPCSFSTEDGVVTRHDCPPGNACVVVSAVGPPRCLRLCSADDPSSCTGAYAGVEGARPDGACALGIGSAAGLEDVRACMMMHDCDPRCDDCPSRYDACIPVADTLRLGFACFAYIPGETGDGRTGDPCWYMNSCRPGYGCFEVDESTGERECRPSCDLEPDDDDPPCPFTYCGAHEGVEAEGTCTAVSDLRFLMEGLGLCLAE